MLASSDLCAQTSEQLERLESSYRDAERRNALWLDTTKQISQARGALKTGDCSVALRAANNATAQIALAIEQAQLEYAFYVWRRLTEQSVVDPDELNHLSKLIEDGQAPQAEALSRELWGRYE
ncbi:MAG: hypothetical protein AAF384_03305 [Pseudomonadota bacterium]